ncbi:MAG TPA: hypothetical protein VMA35_01720 [Candidatus Sulfopaludibacter sp.]|nr:hypothetical protein [Candidatus Sulfopaludibacter sp.]
MGYTQEVIVRFGKIAVVFALTATLGAHWALLQTVAWTAMLADNLRSQPLAEAVVDTFDGQHPCPLCKAIAAGRKSEHKSEAAAPTPKLEFPPANANVRLFAPSRFELIPPADFSADSLAQKPPVPPPRGFFV